jgi:pyrroline-5-carboxylate reductase
VKAAALIWLQEGDTTEQLRDAVERAAGITIRGVRNVPASP